MAEETKEKKDDKEKVVDTSENRKKGLLDALNSSSIGGLFGGRPWILLIVIGFVLFVLLFVVLVSVFGRKNAAANSSAFANEGFLTVGLVVGEDRYAAHASGGTYSGIEPTLASSLAEAEGLSVKFIEADSPEAVLTMLDNGEVDMALGRISTNRDLSRYSVSDPYGKGSVYFLTALHDYTDSLALMAGYSVGIMNNVDALCKDLEGYLYISPHEYTSGVTLAEDIKARKVSFGLCNERDAIILVKGYPNDLQLQEASNGPKEHYVAVFRGRGNAQATLFNAVISNYLDELATK